MDSFDLKLIRWQEKHGRHNLPWQNTRDPYAIWLSEIMLQQTQVSTVIPYYQRFLQSFPDIRSLAQASLDEVLARWSGLGYYSRGRNLHRAARLIVRDYQAKFPASVDMILKLPGIGRSTAAAIAVFAYGERCAILDGNVKRVLSRCFGIEGYSGEKKNETLLWQKAEELLPPLDGTAGKNTKGRVEAYTQALMDLGATVCTRSKPKCASCPLQLECVAFRGNLVDKLPSPRPRKPLPSRETVLLVLTNAGKIFLEKRPPEGIWGGMWCLPEMAVSEDTIEHCKHRFGMDLRMPAQIQAQMQPFDHTFTHFRLRIYPQLLQVISVSSATVQHEGTSTWITLDDALQSAIPAPVRKLFTKLRSSSDEKHG
ncbi:A/G-specific DNA-adenine glycosylase [Nitrosospira sp. Nsp2]|uniref:A/G-specific adenine glycosylase n=1 Tax=Nitrosospira sp. Nsp2 TaxID=136548 RepID=UPI000D316626|nr:A/G-specific adenine glycosylase [Nitrosospira sp. Nsp2]PTR14445.1 A/G-specific DNA-adenine glycosylase [Nitrosospira sp. Nsp2]